MTANKRILIICTILLAAPRTALAQWSIGMGVHDLWIHTQSEEDGVRSNDLPGLFWTVGKLIPFRGRNGLMVSAEVGFADRGIQNGFGDYAYLEGQVSEGHFTIPILVGRSFPLSERLSIIPFIGPSVSIGLWSTLSIDQNRDNWIRDFGEKVNLYSPKTGYSRWFYGIRTGFAFYLPKESGCMAIGADLGLNDRYSGKNPKVSIASYRLYLAFNILI